MGEPALLDKVLEAAPDIDHALLLAGLCGWRLRQADASPPWGGGYFVLMEGPEVETINLLHATPTIRIDKLFSNATFKSLYGAIVLAFVRGLASRVEMEQSVASFREKIGKKAA